MHPRQRVFYLTRRAVEDKHDGDRFERLRYDSKRPRICLCLRKLVVTIELKPKEEQSI